MRVKKVILSGVVLFFLIQILVLISYQQANFLKQSEFLSEAKALRVVKDIGSIEKIQAKLKERNQLGQSNYPLILQAEEPELFEQIKNQKISYYSEVDGCWYVWSTQQVQEIMQFEYDKGNNDEEMTAIVSLDEEGRPAYRFVDNLYEGRPDAKTILDINFRSDRQRQIARVIYNEDFPFFDRSTFHEVNFFGMAQYIDPMPEECAILPNIVVKDGLIETLAKHGWYITWSYDREKAPFITTARGGRSQPYEGEDSSFASISMPVRYQEVEDPNTGEKYWVYDQIPNKNFWLYPDLTNDIVAEGFAELVAKAPEDRSSIINTNLSLLDLNGHASSKKKDVTDTIMILDESFKPLVFSGDSFEEMIGKYIDSLKDDNDRKKNLESYLENARQNKTVEIIVEEPWIAQELGIEGISDNDELRLVINFVDNTIMVEKLIPITGNGYDSIEQSLIRVDKSLKTVLDALKEKDGIALIFGDHGSVDDFSTTGHSFGDVPFFVVKFEDGKIKHIKLLKDGTQADIAATLLEMAGVDKPELMTGSSLLAEQYLEENNIPFGYITIDGLGKGDPNDPEGEMNLILKAMREGKMPTLKSLFDAHADATLKATGYYAGLRGGKQEDFRKEDLLDREQAIATVQQFSQQDIELIYYDYLEVDGSHQSYNYEEGLYELKNSPFLNDKDFVVKQEGGRIKVYLLDPSQMGSTEFNTWTIYAGRIVEQSVRNLDKQMLDGSLWENPVIQRLEELYRKQGFANFWGFLQEFAVHSSLRHLYYFIQHLHTECGINNFMINGGSDGRDEDTPYGVIRIGELAKAFQYFGIPVENYSINIVGRDIADRKGNYGLTNALWHLIYYGSRIRPF